jgi:hypothetical protein
MPFAFEIAAGLAAAITTILGIGRRGDDPRRGDLAAAPRKSAAGPKPATYVRLPKRDCMTGLRCLAQNITADRRSTLRLFPVDVRNI